jgi:L-malate glycosyltransferase
MMFGDSTPTAPKTNLLPLSFKPGVRVNASQFQSIEGFRLLKIGITCHATYGGSGAVATELGIQLAEKGHEVHFISNAQPFRLRRFQERIYFHEVEMEQYPLFEHPPYTLALAVALHDAVETHDLDVLHVHYAIPHAASAWIAGEMLGNKKPPVVTTLHGTDITLVGLHPSFHRITQFAIQKSDGITAVSEFLKEETVRDFSVPGERIDVIPNFVDTRFYHPDKVPCHRGTLAEEGEWIMMHISNFRPVKRVTDVVEVFARVSREIPARLVMVGDGPERPRARQRAAALGVEDRVVFLGKHDSVDELLSCADLFLLTSDAESFGLAALEAMASGAPVVGSDAGGIVEVVPDGSAGFLHPVGDVDAMAASALRLVREDDMRADFQKVGRELAKTRFSVETVVPQYEALYERVIEAAQ